MKNLPWLKTVFLFLSCAGQWVLASDVDSLNKAFIEKSREIDAEPKQEVNTAAPEMELLDFITEFGDLDDEQFDIILFHGKRDAEKERNDPQKKAIEDRGEVTND